MDSTCRARTCSVVSFSSAFLSSAPTATAAITSGTSQAWKVLIDAPFVPLIISFREYAAFACDAVYSRGCNEASLRDAEIHPRETRGPSDRDQGHAVALRDRCGLQRDLEEKHLL